MNVSEIGRQISPLNFQASHLELKPEKQSIFYLERVEVLKLKQKKQAQL